MNPDQLRQIQAPLKQAYRDNPALGQLTLTARARCLPQRIACEVATHTGPVVAGLHPAAGGDGQEACSGDMLLQALVACSGVTLAAVATAMSIELGSATVSAEAELDFRGTLGVERTCPVGMSSLRLMFELQSPVEDGQLDKLVQLTERYCVVLQTLVDSVPLSCQWKRG